MRLHHVQLACPPGEEQGARAFYAGVLGLTEVAKPPELAKRGGCWFRGEHVEIHIGVEQDFRAARKAHPAFVLESRAELESLAQRLVDAGFEVDWSQRHTFDGFERCHTFDAAGNRVELLAAAPPA